MSGEQQNNKNRRRDKENGHKMGSEELFPVERRHDPAVQRLKHALSEITKKNTHTHLM